LEFCADVNDLINYFGSQLEIVLHKLYNI